jgi:hypothetical protein
MLVILVMLEKLSVGTVTLHNVSSYWVADAYSPLVRKIWPRCEILLPNFSPSDYSATTFWEDTREGNPSWREGLKPRLQAGHGHNLAPTLSDSSFNHFCNIYQ